MTPPAVVLGAVNDALTMPQGIKGTATVFQFTGMAVGDTIEFEGTVDGENWASVEATKLVDGTQSVNITGAADGLYRVDGSGLTSVRARKSASAGNVNATAFSAEL